MSLRTLCSSCAALQQNGMVDLPDCQFCNPPRIREKEKVNHPAHYGGDVPHEAIKCIAAWGLNFQLGNAAKYICRAGKKQNESTLEDLKKARWYLDWEIKRLESESA